MRVFTTLVTLAFAQDKVGETISVQAPSITEEDQYGYRMPEAYKCSGCRVVTRHLNAKLDQVTNKRSRKPKSWELVSYIEDLCASPKEFDGYGVSMYQGQNVLTGPKMTVDEYKSAAELSEEERRKKDAKKGKKAETNGLGMASIQMGGDMWKRRLAEVCKEVLLAENEEGDFALTPQAVVSGATEEEAMCEASCSSATHVPKKDTTQRTPAETRKKDKKEKKKAEPKMSWMEFAHEYGTRKNFQQKKETAKTWEYLLEQAAVTRAEL